MKACREGHTAVVQALTAAKADLDIKNKVQA
jgi:ankyrin repeat protein